MRLRFALGCLLGYKAPGSGVCLRVLALELRVFDSVEEPWYRRLYSRLDRSAESLAGTYRPSKKAALQLPKNQVPTRGARSHPCRPRILVYKVPNGHRPLAAAISSSSTNRAARATREATKTPKPAPYAASSAAPASAKTRARPCRRARAPPPNPYWKNRRTRRH